MDLNLNSLPCREKVQTVGTSPSYSPIDADHHALPELIADECLVHLGQAHLHRPPSMLDGGDGRSAGTAVVAGHLDDVRIGLGNTTGDNADAGLGHQLDRHLGLVVDLAEAKRA